MSEIDKIIQRAQMEAYDAWRSRPNHEAYVMQGFAHAAALAAAAIEARVRAELAEEIARYLAQVAEGCGQGALHRDRKAAFQRAAEIAREHAGLLQTPHERTDTP